MSLDGCENSPQNTKKKKMYRTRRFVCLPAFFVLFISSLTAQGLSKQDRVKEIMAIRQQLFNDEKNEPMSCEEMKTGLKQQLLQANHNVRDLDPLESAQWNAYLKCPQTDWESVLERSAVELYKTQLLNGVRRLNITLPKNITWLPSRCPCFNASATHLGSDPNDANLQNYWLIEINTALEISLGEYAKIAALVTPIQRRDGQIVVSADTAAYIDVLEKNKTLSQHFLKRLVAHMLNLPILEEKSISIGQPHLSLYSQYSTNAQIFALAHELSHVILQHRFAPKGLVSTRNDKPIQLEVSSFTEGLPSTVSYKQEYAADSLGLEIMLAVLEAKRTDDANQPAGQYIMNKAFGIYGAEMLLTWVELFQKAEIATHGAYTGASSHPPAQERRNRIRRILRRKSLLVPERDFGLSTYKAMMLIWETLKPEWISSLAPLIKGLTTKDQCRHTD